MSAETRADRTGPPLLPVMQYRDLGRAIGWLKEGFGFAEHETVRGDNGEALYAVMRFRDAFLMLGPVSASDLGGHMKQPDEIGGAETQSCYLIVDDIDAHYAQAKAAGAQILFDLTDYHHGGRGYSCRDPEGHIWTFGNYDPRARAIPSPRRVAAPAPVLAAGALALMVISAGSSWLLFTSGVLPGFHTVPVSAFEAERHARQGAEHQTQEERTATAREHAGRQVAERQAQLAENDLARERTAHKETTRQLAAAQGERTAGQQRLQETAQEIDRQRQALDSFNKQLLAAMEARDAAGRRAQTLTEELHRQQRTAEGLKKQLAAATSGKDEAERTAKQAKQDLEQARVSAAALEKKLVAETDAKAAASKQLGEAREQLDRQKAKLASLEQQLREETGAKEQAKKAAEQAQAKLTELEAAKQGQERKTGADADVGQAPAPREAPRRPASTGGQSSGPTTGANAAPMPALVP